MSDRKQSEMIREIVEALASNGFIHRDALLPVNLFILEVTLDRGIQLHDVAVTEEDALNVQH